MAEVISVIDPDNGAGTDYTSLNAWESGQAGDQGGNDPVAECRSSGGSADTTDIQVNGFTNYGTIIIRNHSSEYHGGRWNTNTFRIEPALTSSMGIRVLLPNFRISGIQISVANTPDAGRSGIFSIGEDNVEFDHLIIKGKGGASGLGIYSTGTGPQKVYNCIIYDWNGVGGKGFQIETLSTSKFYAYNNTVDNCETGYYSSGGLDMVSKNNIAQNCTTCFGGGMDASLSEYNISDDTTAPGTNSQISVTVTFINITGDDYHLALSDTIARGNGVDLSADSILPFSDDVNKGLRVAWDVGADEYGVGTPNNAYDTFTGADTTLITSRAMDSGHVWNMHPTTGSASSISSNQVRSSGAGSLHMCSIIPASANYIVGMDITAAPVGAVTHGPIVRLDATVATYYDCFWHSVNARWELRRWNAGVSTTLASYAGDSPEGTVRSVELEVGDSGGNPVLTVRIGAIQRISYTDIDANKITAMGSAGFYNGDSTNVYGDNWYFTESVGGTIKTVTDTAAGADAIGNIANLFGIADSGAGNDSMGGMAAQLAVVDSGAGIEAIGAAITLTITDTGGGVDSISIITAVLKTVSDTASGSDSVAGISAQLLVADNGAGVELPTIAVALQVSDSASGADVVNTLQQALIQIFDNGLGSDGLTIGVSLNLQEIGVGIDSPVIAAFLSVLDSMTGVDVASGYNAQTQLLGIVLSVNTRKIVLTLNTRTLTLEFNTLH